MTSYTSSHPYQFCNNCGKTGHSYNQCSKPITSNGIIAFTKIGNNIKYLLICRKDTLGYVEFLRGKYPLYNKDYIQNIINEMTVQEKANLLTKDFATGISNSGSSVRETLTVSPIPSSSKVPIPTEDLILPSSPSPASVTPK